MLFAGSDTAWEQPAESAFDVAALVSAISRAAQNSTIQRDTERNTAEKD